MVPEVADLILVLDRGQIVERGTHAEHLKMGDLYARLDETQFRCKCEEPIQLIHLGTTVKGMSFQKLKLPTGGCRRIQMRIVFFHQVI